MNPTYLNKDFIHFFNEINLNIICLFVIFSYKNIASHKSEIDRNKSDATNKYIK